MKIIDIGCGANKYPGAIGIDAFPRKDADIILDITKDKLPFEDSSIDMVVCSHILEHMTNIIPSLNEIYRVMKPEGILKIKVPHYTHVTMWGNITHYRGFCSTSFYQLDKNFSEHYGDFDFKVKSLKLIYDTGRSGKLHGIRKVMKPIMKLFEQRPEVCEWIFGSLFGGFEEISVELIANKD